jgi:hypothetical protein
LDADYPSNGVNIAGRFTPRAYLHRQRAARRRSHRRAALRPIAAAAFTIDRQAAFVNCPRQERQQRSRQLFLEVFVKAAILALAVSSAALVGHEAAAKGPTEALETSLKEEAAAANGALADGDYAAAALHFEAAQAAAKRLSLQGVLARVSKASPAFTAEQSRFVLATSSTLQFERLLKDRNAAETRFINPEGKVVIVRAFGGEDDMADFKFVADDPAMLKRASLEKAQMPGGPALKRRTANGGLSVLIMSPDDHALIEVEGASEADVMAVVDAMEGKAGN